MKWQGTSILALAALPAMLLGQQGQRSEPQSQQPPQGQQQQQDTITQSAPGALERPSSRRNLGLTTDQVKELQQAINNAGCNAGPVDGIIGRQTRAGIACVHHQKNISGNNLNDVFRELGLSFTASDSTFDPSSWTSQTQSGVVNPKTGKSTLGPEIKKREPTQGAPVMLKGDTLKKGGDTVPKPGADTSGMMRDSTSHR